MPWMKPKPKKKKNIIEKAMNKGKEILFQEPETDDEEYINADDQEELDQEIDQATTKSNSKNKKVK